MAKKTEIETVETSEKGGREARWEAHLEVYAKENPVKYAAKEKAGEFKTIPESFV